mmetsp:Transcript_917/g.2142  ORF Transcript_917/g.2142 Transcript_917/m.2142 type:complete len:626 (-) Transcript_917:189-2066(-)
MTVCGAGKAISHLQRYAESISSQHSSLDADLPAPLFPMYTVPVPALLDMTEIEPHEVLMSQGALVEFHQDLGKAAFVSHQWVGVDHPDPECRQLRVLQDAFKSLLSEVDFVPLEIFTESLVPSAKPLETAQFRDQPLFIWYDYFSCPQLKQSLQQPWSLGSHHQPDLLSKAIDSIPAYIAECSYFLGLCPVVDCPDDGRVLGPISWAQRGWCRVERVCRELSRDGSWILIQSDVSLALVGTELAFVGGAVGEGEFTLAQDRLKLAPVLKEAVRRTLLDCLASFDFESYRLHLNMQTVHLRGLNIGPVTDLVPGFEPGFGGIPDVVAEFLHQNGFRTVLDMDDAGWAPVHYAALGGRTDVIEGLLRQRADPNRRTSKDQPKVGCPVSMSALDLTMLFKHNDAARLLIAAGARMDGSIMPSMAYASISNNPEGICILCNAGADPQAENQINIPMLDVCSGYGSLAALEALLAHALPGTLNFSQALWSSMWCSRGGTAEMVERLVGLRADVNHQRKIRTGSALDIFQVAKAKSRQHQSDEATTLAALWYHIRDMTPLMGAVITAQYEGAAALIACGARQDLRNTNGWSAKDFAAGQSIPRCLKLAFEGDASECVKVYRLALAHTSVEI